MCLCPWAAELACLCTFLQVVCECTFACVNFWCAYVLDINFLVVPVGVSFCEVARVIFWVSATCLPIYKFRQTTFIHAPYAHTHKSQHGSDLCVRTYLARPCAFSAMAAADGALWLIFRTARLWDNTTTQRIMRKRRRKQVPRKFTITTTLKFDNTQKLYSKNDKHSVPIARLP